MRERDGPRGGVLPKRIILVRHGESQGNNDPATYDTTPDPKIQLTAQGIAQAQLAGARMRHAVAGGGSTNWRVYFYVSPYARTRSTLREIGRSFSKKRVIGVREECRIREQDFGNFQVQDRMNVIKEARQRFGRFFYRFPEGESAADVFDRVSSTLSLSLSLSLSFFLYRSLVLSPVAKSKLNASRRFLELTSIFGIVRAGCICMETE